MTITDFDRDGDNDIVASKRTTDGLGAPGIMLVYIRNDATNNTMAKLMAMDAKSPLGSFMDTSDMTAKGGGVSVADVNRDGVPDIVAGFGGGGPKPYADPDPDLDPICRHRLDSDPHYRSG